MGLGPPVCGKCLVLYTFKHSYGWECPVCHQNDDNQLGLFECNYSHEWLEGNLRWWKFIKGLNNEPTDPEPDNAD